MLLQDLTKKLEAIKKQQENLKQQEKELSNQAVKERVLEVDIYQLIKEIQRITKSSHADAGGGGGQYATLPCRRQKVCGRRSDAV